MSRRKFMQASVSLFGWVICWHCGGKGTLGGIAECPTCEGKGYVWKGDRP